MKRKRNDENRFLCKVCNIWIANNKAQRDQHESGAKHKAAQAALIKDIANKNSLKQKEQKQQSRRRTVIGPSQLLEHAIRSIPASAVLPASSATPEESVQRPAPPVPNPNDHVNGPEHTVDGTASAENLDDGEYPLPADQVYGQWQTVDDDEGSDNNEDKDEGNSYDRVYSRNDDDRQQPNAESSVGDDQEETVKQVSVCFKKRKTPNTSKRKKRKT